MDFWSRVIVSDRKNDFVVFVVVVVVVVVIQLLSNLSSFDRFMQWQNIFTSLQTWIDLIEICIYCWRENILRCHIIEITTLKYRSYRIYVNICLLLTGLCSGKHFYLPLQTWIHLIEIYISSWRKNILRLYIIEIATLKYRSYGT